MYHILSNLSYVLKLGLRIAGALAVGTVIFYLMSFPYGDLSNLPRWVASFGIFILTAAFALIALFFGVYNSESNRDLSFLSWSFIVATCFSLHWLFNSL